MTLYSLNREFSSSSGWKSQFFPVPVEPENPVPIPACVTFSGTFLEGFCSKVIMCILSTHLYRCINYEKYLKSNGIQLFAKNSLKKTIKKILFTDLFDWIRGWDWTARIFLFSGSVLTCYKCPHQTTVDLMNSSYNSPV